MFLLKLKEAKGLQDEVLKVLGFPEVPIGGEPLSRLRPPIFLFPHKVEVTPHKGKRFGGGGKGSRESGDGSLSSTRVTRIHINAAQVKIATWAMQMQNQDATRDNLMNVRVHINRVEHGKKRVLQSNPHPCHSGGTMRPKDQMVIRGGPGFSAPLLRMSLLKKLDIIFRDELSSLAFLGKLHVCVHSKQRLRVPSTRPVIPREWVVSHNSLIAFILRIVARDIPRGTSGGSPHRTKSRRRGGDPITASHF